MYLFWCKQHYRLRSMKCFGKSIHESIPWILIIYLHPYPNIFKSICFGIWMHFRNDKIFVSVSTKYLDTLGVSVPKSDPSTNSTLCMVFQKWKPISLERNMACNHFKRISFNSSYQAKLVLSILELGFEASDVSAKKLVYMVYDTHNDHIMFKEYLGLYYALC